MGRYSPLSYHNGSVWPHDTAIGIAGLRRYGFVDEANRVALGLLSAADALGGRLPELFAGLTIEEMPVPVRYPTSCSPQAWASASPLLLVRAFLGLEPCRPAGSSWTRSSPTGRRRSPSPTSRSRARASPSKSTAMRSRCAASREDWR
jgi:glycogen debranching enzyme